MNKNHSKREYILGRKGILLGFAVSSIFCILLDIFFSTIEPDKGMDGAKNFDESIMSQFIYISVGCTCSIAVGSIANLLNYKYKVAHGLVGRDNDTFIISLAVIVFFVYFFSLVLNPAGIVGFDIGYKDIKSVIEHFINPIILLFTYYAFIKYKVNEKQYAKKEGGIPLIFVTIGLATALIREAMLVSFDPTYEPGKHGTEVKNVIPAFPYTAVDPFLNSPAIGIPALLGIEFGTYGVCNFFNGTGNIAYKHHTKMSGFIDGAKVSEDDLNRRLETKAQHRLAKNRFE